MEMKRYYPESGLKKFKLGERKQFTNLIKNLKLIKEISKEEAQRRLDFIGSAIEMENFEAVCIKESRYKDLGILVYKKDNKYYSLFEHYIYKVFANNY